MRISIANNKYGLSPPFAVLLIALVPIVHVPPASAGEDAYGPVRQLTFSDANDEDGAFAVADDGAVYFAWISDRAGNTDVRKLK